MADEYEWGDVGDVIVAVAAIAVASGLESALKGGGSKDAAGAQTQYALKQSLPPTVNLVGHYSRTAGAYAVYDTKDEVLFKLQAINRGRIAEAPTRWWLHDDEVERSSGEYVARVIDGVDDGRYSGVQTDLRHRLGLPTETKYTDIWLDRFPYYHDDPNFRLDNTAAVMMIARAPKADQRSSAYPLGQPELSCAARGVCYDWRQDSTAGGSGSQRRDNHLTWGPSYNPIVWGVHLEWYRWRMDWDRCIAPVLADLTAQANICDEAVALKAGGTEPRYTFAGNYLGNETQVNIRQRILDAMDGFWTRDGLGRLVIKAGKVETTNLFTLTQDMIEGWTWQRGTASEDSVSQIAITFTSPDHKFNEVDCDPWIVDETAPNGADMKLQWVYRLSQARRLAKRRASRLRPRHKGTIRTGPWGIFGFSERYIRVQNPQQVTMEDVICEVLEAEIDPMSGDVVFTVIEADPAIDSWNPATEEGSPAQITGGATGSPLAQPTITDADAFRDGGITRVNIDVTGPSRGDITWIGSHRVGTSGVWNDEASSGVTGTPASFNTGAVSEVPVLQVRAAYMTGSGELSPWSEPVSVDTRYTEPAPSAPTSLTASSPSSGVIDIGFVQSSSASAAYVKIYRGTTNVFSDATQVNSVLASPSQALTYAMSGLSAGTYYIWVVAATMLGTPSTPTGPASVAVTVGETAPAAPTSLAVSSPLSGAIDLTVTQSATASARFLNIYRGTTNVFSSAVQVGSIFAVPSQAVSYAMTGLSAGTYYIWVVAATAAGTVSTATGPASVAVTTGETAPASPTGLTVTNTAPLVITVNVTQSSSPSATTLKIYRGTTNVFSAATLVDSMAASASQAISRTISGQSAGTYYLWAEAVTAAGTPSTPAGPQAVVL